MKTQTKYIDPSERKALLTDILNNPDTPRNPAGQVKWQELFKDPRHTIAAVKLGYGIPKAWKRTEVMASFLRKKASAAPAPAPAIQEPPAEGKGGGGEQIPRQLQVPHKLPKAERNAIYAQIAEYRNEHGKTDFNAAFTAHPEWLGQLGAKDFHDKLPLARIRAAVGSLLKKSRPRPQRRTKHVAEAAPETNGEVPHGVKIHWCPNCGQPYATLPPNVNPAALAKFFGTAARLGAKYAL